MSSFFKEGITIRPVPPPIVIFKNNFQPKNDLLYPKTDVSLAQKKTFFLSSNWPLWTRKWRILTQKVTIFYTKNDVFWTQKIAFFTHKIKFLLTQ